MYRASREDLIKLVKEHGKLEADSVDSKSVMLRINLTDTGYSKKHSPLEVVLNEQYPNYDVDFTLDLIFPDDDTELKIMLSKKR